MAGNGTLWPDWHAGGVEQATLQRARDGDEQAFRELTDPYRTWYPRGPTGSLP